MFELSVACKYLIPRWRQLSVSIISMVSMLVIALVVWLIVVFFSVKDGLEGNWVEKIVALSAPMRLTPTSDYYRSHYYLIDSISADSDYSSKSLQEKLLSAKTNPYDPFVDEELPHDFPSGDLNADGTLRDIVKETVEIVKAIPHAKHLKISDFSHTVANVHLRMLRGSLGSAQQSQQMMNQAVYLGSFDAEVPALAKALLDPSNSDLYNLLHMQGVSSENVREDSPEHVQRASLESLRQRLGAFFSHIDIEALAAPGAGWKLPLHLIPAEAHYKAIAIVKDNEIARLYLPKEPSMLPVLLESLKRENASAEAVDLYIQQGRAVVQVASDAPKPLPPWVPLVLPGGTLLKASLNKSSIDHVRQVQEISFRIEDAIQQVPLTGEIPLGKLLIGKAKVHPSKDPLIAYHDKASHAVVLPPEMQQGAPILLPRTFKERGIQLGDQGYLAYYSPTPSSVQEMRQIIVVAGFYDPGILPIGSKYVLADRVLIETLRSSSGQNEVLAGNGFNLRFDNIKDAPRIQQALSTALDKASLGRYWQLQSYLEYEFSKDLMQQLHSEKNLFSIVSFVIIIVACSNIISMLIILVNDKRQEIGILRSMGASSASIAAIFGICGMVMGAIGSIVGILASFVTLRYINELVYFLGYLQGHDLFNPVFYGHTLPAELSYEALSFVIAATALISLLAGIVPAVKACAIRPANILRNS